MATTTETKIIEIRVQSTEALNRIDLLSKEIETLQNDLKTLNATYKEGTMHEDYYIKRKTVLTAAIKAHRQEIATLSREIVNNVKQSKEKLGYIQKLEAQVSNLTLKYKQLSEAELKGSKGAEVLKNLTAKREELSQMNQAYGNHTMEVGKYGKATNQLNMQMTQLMREMPNFAISTRIGIMALTNNLPYFVESMKAVRTELSAMRAAGEKAPSFLSAMTKSLFSFNAVVMIGITLLQLFGEDVVNWIGSLFKAKDATDKLNESQLGLKSTMDISRDAMKDGGEYKQAISNIEKLSVTLKAAKGNTDLEKAAVDEYNKTLGVTFGKVSDVDSALKKINENEKAYIEAMKNMSFANAFFAQSAEDATKAMEVGLKTNAELVGESSEYYIEEIAKVDKIATSTKRRLNELISGGATEQQIKVQTDLVAEYEKKQSDIRTAYNNAAAKEREKQIAAIQKHQNKTLEEATKYYEKYAKAFKDNNWVVAEDEKKKRKETFDYEAKLREATAKGLDENMSREMAVVIANEKKKQDELKAAYDKKLVTQTQYTTLSIAYEEQRNRELSDITEKYTTKEIDKIKKLFEEDKKARDKKTKDALDANQKELEARVRTAQDILRTSELNNNDTLAQKLNLLKAERELEVTAAYERGESVKAVNDYYNALEAEAKRQNSIEKVKDTIEYAKSVSQIMESTFNFSNALGDAELARWAKQNKGKANYDEEYAKKKAELDHKAAVRNKAMQVVNSIINTAGAVVAALPNVPLSIAAGIAGAIQTAAIIATPIPDKDATSASGGSSPSLPPDLTSKMASPLTNSVQTMGAMGGSNAITSGAANAAISPAFDYNAMAKVMSNLPAPELSIVELRTKERQVDFIDNISTLKS